MRSLAFLFRCLSWACVVGVATHSFAATIPTVVAIVCCTLAETFDEAALHRVRACPPCANKRAASDGEETSGCNSTHRGPELASASTVDASSTALNIERSRS